MPSISTENIHLGNSKAIAQFIKSISMNNKKWASNTHTYRIYDTEFVFVVFKPSA
jgi:hypothetical protein